MINSIHKLKSIINILRSNEQSVSIFNMSQKENKEIYAEALHDQIYLYMQLERDKQNLNYKFFDRNHFANGWWMKNALSLEKCENETFIVHANFVVGIDRKKSKLEGHNAWFL